MYDHFLSLAARLFITSPSSSMYTAMSFHLLVPAIFLSFTTPILAQSSSCSGDTTSYPLNGVLIPFKNLCGKDIGAAVDFLDPTWENSFGDCMRKCVEKKTLCYRFDYNFGPMQFNCWLMNASFPESSAYSALNPRVDAAMLSSDVLNGLSEDCKSLGLKECWSKNGALGTMRATTSSQRVIVAATTGTATGTSVVPALTLTAVAAPSATSGTDTPSSTPSSGGFSAGAKAGIGAGVGIGALVLLGLAALFLLKRRKSKPAQDDIPQTTDVSEKPKVEYPPRSGTNELHAQHGLYVDAELEGTNMSPTAAQLHGTYGYGELHSPTEGMHEAQRNQWHSPTDSFHDGKRHELHGSHYQYGR